MSEAELQKAVIALARTLGYRCAHFPRTQNSRGAWVTTIAADAKGFPDVVAAKPGRLLFLEFKSDRGSLRPEQKEWQKLLGTIVVRPKDWLAGDVERLLK